ncbi:MAG: hypothetical protein QE484_05890, partial [Rhizobium sp.]|nr:hypothetical protein [Rhizobium sp.]
MTWRLAVALAIPLVALAGLAYVEINTTFTAYQHARHLNIVSADLGVIGDLVHVLQGERAEAVGLLASKGKEHGPELEAMRSKAAPALGKMDQVLADMKAEGDPTLLRHEEELAAV